MPISLLQHEIQTDLTCVMPYPAPDIWFESTGAPDGHSKHPSEELLLTALWILLKHKTRTQEHTGCYTETHH